MNRRDYLKGIGTAGTLTVGGGALLLSSTSPAVAASFTISDPSAATSDDGSLNYVRLQADQTVEWDGFDEEVHYARYLDRVTVRPNDQNVTRTVNDTTSDSLDNWSSQGNGSDGWGGPDEYTSGPGNAGFVHAGIDWNVIGDPNANDPAEGGPRSVETPADLLGFLEEDSDGTTKQSTVVFTKEVRLLDANQNELAGPNGPHDAATSSDNFVVEVTNEEATTDSSGSGSASVSADDESP